MRPINWSGAAKVANLIEMGFTLSEIVDRYGHAVHKDAEEFCMYHKQAKRMFIKAALTNPALVAEMHARDKQS